MSRAALRSRNGRSDEGFTLLELIVVLVIVGLAAAIVGPRTGQVSPQVELRAAVQRLAADMRILRADALKTGSARTVTIDPQKRAYWSGDNGRPTTLPTSVQMRLEAADLATENGAPRVITDRLRIVFAPDGSSSGGRIALASGKLGALVTVDWLTGAARVEWRR